MKLEELEQKIKIQFKKKDLLKEALTHRSYLNENPNWHLSHNERLEYLGDAVLELIVSNFLYHKYPDYKEGQLTSVRAALVNYQMLEKVSREISLGDYILLSRGEAKDTGKARGVILADALEALIGAIYLDQGYEMVQEFIEQYIIIHLDEVMEKELYRDSKSLLQEHIQDELKLTPTYNVLNESGPDHNKVFSVGVYYGDKLVAQGEGESKQEAESQAAEKALKKFDELITELERLIEE